MLLTRLDIKGFKSFGDRVRLDFDEGITGVVGPNGCGKSNIIDAIRWVLGEKSVKNLRSDKMSNIIFNGTAKRKAGQYAEVSLTFKNNKGLLPPEYTEVSIGRKYNRKGQSEYLLNDIPCRRRDISNLFLDTGIGSNSYAIIELKMVDSILNDHHARQTMFEEAAGIAKFKIRKKETLFKLKGTQEDLERVEDLLHEITKNMKSLERQAKQAIRYKNSMEVYQGYSIALAKRHIRKDSTEFADLNDKLQAELAEKKNLHEQVTQSDVGLDEMKLQATEKETVLNGKRKQLSQCFHQTRQAESEQKIQQERYKFLKDKRENLEWQLSQDQKNIEEAEQDLKNIEAKKENLIKLHAEAEYKLETFQAEYERQKEQTEIIKQEGDMLAVDVKKKQEEIFVFQKDLDIKRSKESTLKQDLEQIAEDTAEHHDKLDILNEKVLEVHSEIETYKNELQELQETEENLREQIESTRLELDTLKDEQNQINRQLDAKQNEYTLLKSMIENMEGFSESIKFLDKQTDWKEKAVLFSDILKVNPDYQEVMEFFLDSLMNVYVVQNAAHAYAAISLLDENDKGKAQFFILDNFENSTFENSKITIEGKTAIEVVSCENQYQNLLNFVLQNVYIVEADEAQNLKSYPQNVTLVSKNAKLIQRPQSLLGGSVTEVALSRLGRQEQLEKTLTVIQDLTVEASKKEQEIKDKYEEIQNLKDSTQIETIKECQTEIHRLEREQVSLKTEHEQILRIVQTSENKKQILLEKIYELTSEIEEESPKLDTLDDVLQDMEEELLRLTEDYIKRQKDLEEKTEIFNTQNIEFYRYKNHIETVGNEIEYKKEVAQKVKNRAATHRIDIVKAQVDTDQLLDQQAQTNKELAELNKKKQGFQEEVNILENDYYQVREKITTLEKNIREAQRQSENLNTRLMTLQDRLNEIKLQLTALRERLSAEFGIQLTDEMLSEKTPEDDIDQEELVEEIAKAKKRLDGMGAINSMAMEAYEEIKERNDFIIGQRDDLLKAKELLEKTIAQIERAAKKTFLNAFEQIRINFKEVFAALFEEGDTCELTLDDPNNPIDSKIEIMAQPKGKRPLSIKQLSGGEKTLTATALLFAIYLLKPAPFCIFDEVDAPLDDANIDKFNKIIRKFAERVQFIIVTHNKRTMAHTDRMYGVTIIEQGVSRLIPIDLKDLAINDETAELAKDI